MGIRIAHKRRRKFSSQRKQLYISTTEGISTSLFQMLLGGPFLTGYLLYLGADSSVVGLVLSITTLVNLVQVFVAFLVQKFQARKWPLVLFIALQRILWGLTGVIPFVLDKQWWVPVFIILYGSAFLANTFINVLWTSLLGDIVPAGVRGKYFGIRNTITNALGSIMIFVAGKILDSYPESTGFLILFILAWFFGLMNIVTFFFYPDIPFERSTERKIMPMILKPLRDKSFIQSTIFLSGWLFLQTLVVPLFSYVMLDLIHVNYQTVSLLTVVQTISMMSSLYIWGRHNTKYSNRTLLFWTLPIIAGACFVWGFISFLPVLLVLIISHVLLGIGVGGFNQLVFNFTIGDTPKSERPMYIAMFAAITGIATFLGPLIGGQLFKWMKMFPDWVQQYGFQTATGFVMLFVALTLGRRILKEI